MTSAILDASAVLAFLQGEPGADQVEACLMKGAAISAVNLAEVASKLSDGSMDDTTIDEALSLLAVSVLPFDEAQARIAGRLRAATRDAGLSLGDRACLALAVSLQLPAYTTDRAWLRADVSVRVVTVR